MRFRIANHRISRTTKVFLVSWLLGTLFSAGLLRGVIRADIANGYASPLTIIGQWIAGLSVLTVMPAGLTAFVYAQVLAELWPRKSTLFKCKSCGYDLWSGHGLCPECGADAVFDEKTQQIRDGILQLEKTGAEVDEEDGGKIVDL